jgi:hypothetical protein
MACPDAVVTPATLELPAAAARLLKKLLREMAAGKPPLGFEPTSWCKRV